MRPVDRGSQPQVFTDYADAKPFLVNRLGDYCSYCERPIKTLLAVEHVLPKSLHPELREEWTNFLLGCVNCNSTKGSKPVDRASVLLPDQDNTFLAYEYTELGEVFVASGLPEDVGEMAASLLQITGLNKFPDEFDDEELQLAALERWQQRSQAWEVAEFCRESLEVADSPQMRELIVITAAATGFFSVWLAAFVDDSELLLALIDAFPGTSSDCFDENGAGVPKPGGHV